MLSLENIHAQQDSSVVEESIPLEREFEFDEIPEIEEVADIIELAKDIVGKTESIEWDTSKAELARKYYLKRTFDTTEINRYKTLDAFDYTEARSENSPFINWLKRIVRKLFGAMEPPEVEEEQVNSWFSAINILKYIVIILAAGLLAWFLLRSEFKSLIKKKNKSIDPVAGDLDITIQQDVLLTRLQEAIDKRDFRTAVRYKYLIILKQLNEDQYIKWKDYKLSSDYIEEITDPILQKEFRSLTEYFNYAWYGNYQVKADFFNKAVTHFDSIKSKID